MSFIYLVSPYSSPDPLIMKTRFLLAEQVTAKLLSEGKWIYSPIVHCHELAAKYSLPTDFDFWQSYNKAMIKEASALWVLEIPGWRESKGVREEIEFARLLELPIWYVDEHGKDKSFDNLTTKTETPDLSLCPKCGLRMKLESHYNAEIDKIVGHYLCLHDGSIVCTAS